MKAIITAYNAGYIALFILVSQPVWAQATQSPLPFLNEQLMYDVKFNGMGTAYASFTCTAADSGHLLLTWKLKSKSIYRMFFHVDNIYNTLVDTSTWLPVKVEKIIKQKNIEQSVVTQYDRKQLLAYTNTDWQWPIRKDCMDLLSMLYHARIMLGKKSDSLNYVIDLESHIWQITGKMNNDREMLLTFSPALPVVERDWKTDLMTNRISRASTILRIQFGPPPGNIPTQLLFDNSESTVEMRIKE